MLGRHVELLLGRVYKSTVYMSTPDTILMGCNPAVDL